MKIHVICILLTNIFIQLQSLSLSEIEVGYQVTIAIPTAYSKGFQGRAFLIEAEQKTEPFFRAAVSIEAADEYEKYSCSIDVFLGDVKVWSSGHLSRFYAVNKCVLELTENGDLRLKGEKELIGWRSGTSGQGVKRLLLLRTGNLVLVDELSSIKWQSFNFPTDVMLWGQRLSARTWLTSFPMNSTLFYSLEIQHDKLVLYLNSGKSKYSYWEYRPNDVRGITFVMLSSNGLGLFHGSHKFVEIRPKDREPVRFMSLDNRTGNLIFYRYSEERKKFKACYLALNSTCDLPLACGPYEVCSSSGSCSCIGVFNCKNENLKGFCGKKIDVEMLELRGVVSVLRSVSSRGNIGRDECAKSCLNDCKCLAVGYDGNFGECFLYEVARGIKQVEKRGKVVYMVKLPKGVVVHNGHGENSWLKKWVIVVVGLVDGLIILIVLGGIGYYVILKRRRNLLGRGQGT
ncbi:D-mannose binding lectin protein with Apple-like carbohydrate-binding domain [Striga hermonthica]|uniref:D-mannose binding lectin protein with Apple-like carbohydrate-binding domain n=1 Tax=Striga hermonthica TaxID=68872 RepID=A0A9N7NSZ4_STRHE|nr:D-mannose binding lectin protein with Apple-like carbohydrate-binding domain [Striga hermonthica]